MPSHKFVPERSKNFTSHAQIRFPPTTPINPVFGKVPDPRTEEESFTHKLSKWIVKTDKRQTPWSLLCHSMLCHSAASGCLEHAVFFTVITTGGQACVACVMLNSSLNSITTSNEAVDPQGSGTVYDRVGMKSRRID